MNKYWFIFFAIIISIVFSIFGNSFQQSNQQIENIEYVFLNNPDINEYEKAITRRQFDFPIDFGSHESFQTEWWYYTGNLLTENGRQFGYQLTFFRKALPTVIVPESRNSAWATDQIYLAHFTLTDTQNNRHYQFETVSRGAAGLAGAKSETNFEVWLYDWSVKQIGLDTFKIHAQKEEISLDLTLSSKKDAVFHGDMGLSQKGPQIGNASYYFSQTRLETEGKIKVGDSAYTVKGNSWMDHEFGTSALGKGQVGWDWFSIQLDSNIEIMIFQIRDSEGNISEYSSGSFIDKDGNLTIINKEDIDLEVLNYWKTSDGYIYPNGWRLISDRFEFDFNIEPVVKDQENRFFFRYWEGSVRITGVIDNKSVDGYGYVELTGYAQSMENVF